MDRDRKIEKRPWTKPELIVLLRGRPEEAVLLACKRTGYPLGGTIRLDCTNRSNACVSRQRVTS